MEKTITGYIIRCVAYQESSAIIDVLTSEGIVSFKARGVYKSPSKFASSTQLYTKGEYQLTYKQENGKATLIAARTIDYLKPLFFDLRVSAVLALLVETIIKNSDEEDWFQIFEYIYEILKQEFNYGALINIILKYNSIYAGSYLSASNCIGCGSKKNIVAVSFNYGGFLCSDCARKYNIVNQNKEYLLAFRYILLASYQNCRDFELSNDVAKLIADDFFQHLEHSSGLTFKCKEIVLDCF